MTGSFDGRPAVEETRTAGPGTVSIERSFAVGDEIRLSRPMAPRWTVPDPRIDSIRGCVAVERGPLVLCLESVDLAGGRSVDAVRVDPGSGLEDHDGAVIAGGSALEVDDEPWPYRPDDATRPGSEITLPLTPYHRWANRGPATMRVWIPQTQR